MSYTDFAKVLVQEAKESKHHMTWRQTSELPTGYPTMQRMVNLVSESGCKVKTYDDKFVVIDMSWIK